MHTRGLTLLVWLVVGAILASITSVRASLWTNELALWADAVAKAPNKPRPWINLGRQYALANQDLFAADAYREAMRVAQLTTRTASERTLGPVLAEANLAVLQFNRGDVAAAQGTISAAHSRAPHIASVVALKQWIDRGR